MMKVGMNEISGVASNSGPSAANRLRPPSADEIVCRVICCFTAVLLNQGWQVFASDW